MLTKNKNMQPLEGTPVSPIYGPSAPTKLSLMGIRFLEGEGGANPTDKETPEPAEKEAEPLEETKATEPAEKDDLKTETDTSKPNEADKSKEKSEEEQLAIDLKRAKELRKENANKRAENTQLKAAAKEASTALKAAQARVEELEKELGTYKTQESASAAESKKKAILKEHGLPDTLTAVLVGDDEETWKKVAKTISSEGRRIVSNTASNGTQVNAGVNGSSMTNDEIYAKYGNL